MKAIVLVEDSQTTSKSAGDPELLDYYKGIFKPVASLVEELSKVAEADIYILSDKYGLCRGRSNLSELEETPDSRDVSKDAQAALSNAVPDADVVVVLLSKSAFVEVVKPIWDELVKTTKPDAIWALGTPQSVLCSLDTDSLRANAELYVYRRSGVAPISIDTRNHLLAAVRRDKQT
jgi:hypothetical protein